jgi:ubiquinone/menaquinone biosynthesis C-methylase UbiE
MKPLDYSIAMAMEMTDNMELVPFLPYIFQDFWELGTPPALVIKHIQKHCKNYSDLRVLDLGSGKGAVSIRLAEAFGCSCFGIDGISEFVEIAKEKAKEFGVEHLCRFVVGDVRLHDIELNKYNVILLGGTGSFYDEYTTTLKHFIKYLADDGIIIIEECYIDDLSDFKHPFYVPKKELFEQFKHAGMMVIDETLCKYDDFMDSVRDLKYITKRCNELILKYPDKSIIFEKYIQKETEEQGVIENKLIGSTMVLKTI